jgi:hypothetical protein
MARRVLSGGVALLDKARHDADGCVLGIERVGELLADGGVLLLELERLEHERVPLVLERVQERRHGRERRRARRGGLRACAWFRKRVAARVLGRDALALTVMRSPSSSFSPLTGSVPFSRMYFSISRRS